MDIYSYAVLRFLGVMSQDATLSLQQRQQATYAAVSFFVHKSPFRLMAQTAAITDGGLPIPPHLNGATEKAESPVNRHGWLIDAIMSDFHVIPSVADFEGHPIELISTLDGIENSLSGDYRFRIHRTLLLMEGKANNDLARSTRKYGYHCIFRAGLRQYYMT